MDKKDETSTVNGVKECPHCNGEISADASKCKHCGEWIDKSKKPNTYGGGDSFRVFLCYFWWLVWSSCGLVFINPR